MNWEYVLNTEKVLAGILGGCLIPVFEFFYGTGLPVMYTVVTLVFFIGMDWLSGSRAAKKDNTYASRYGIDGVFRTLFMLLLPAGGHFLDLIFSTPGVLFGMFTVGLLYHTIKSMTANCIRAGWATWLPIEILEIVTDWVQSEIKSKLSRAQQRMEERERKVGM